jgi:hypothetical protein
VVEAGPDRESEDAMAETLATTTAEQTVLLNCPWCGRPPRVRYGKNFVSIECSNFDCTAFCEADGRSMVEAALRWNTRSDQK